MVLRTAAVQVNASKSKTPDFRLIVVDALSGVIVTSDSPEWMSHLSEFNQFSRIIEVKGTSFEVLSLNIDTVKMKLL